MKACTGHVYLADKEVTGAAPHKLVRRGLGYLPQLANVFDDMSVQENLEMGGYTRKGDLRARIGQVLELFPDLMTKPFHAGHAAEGGLLAASLAGRGFTTAPNILEAHRGFFSAAGGGYDPAKITDRLGDPWTFTDPGVSIKPFPSGSLTHPAMTAFLDLVRAHDLRAEDVEEVRVGTNRHMPNALIHHRPDDHLAAKFSMEFCIAILLLRRRAGLAEFRDEVVRDPEVKNTIEKVRFEVDPEAEAAGYNTMTSIIQVRMKDGRELGTQAAFGKGSPANPMSEAELREKFLGCVTEGGIAADAGQQAADLILDLESQQDLDAITRLLSADPAARARDNGARAETPVQA